MPKLAQDDGQKHDPHPKQHGERTTHNDRCGHNTCSALAAYWPDSCRAMVTSGAGRVLDGCGYAGIDGSVAEVDRKRGAGLSLVPCALGASPNACAKGLITICASSRPSSSSSSALAPDATGASAPPALGCHAAGARGGGGATDGRGRAEIGGEAAGGGTVEGRG